MKHEDLHLGAAKVRPYRGFVKDTKKNLTGLLLDGTIVSMFVLSCYLLYNAIVWSIWS
jgi:hypothetical protein